MQLLEKYKNHDLGLLLVRIGIGLIFVMHGWSKFQDLSGLIGFFSGLGLAPFFAYLVATVETLGGLLLILGLWTDVAALLLGTIMIFAIYLAKWGKPFFGYEFELLLLLCSIAIILMGPGAYTVKKWLKMG